MIPHLILGLSTLPFSCGTYRLITFSSPGPGRFVSPKKGLGVWWLYFPIREESVKEVLDVWSQTSWDPYIVLGRKGFPSLTNQSRTYTRKDRNERRGEMVPSRSDLGWGLIV